MPSTRCVIVDDERLARELVAEFLLPFPEIRVEGQAGNGQSAIALINETKPDLLFLDIQLPDMTGFDVLKGLEYMPMVIFSTAYDQYAIKAFEAHAVDYLLKPLDEDRFGVAIERALQRLDKGSNSLEDLLHSVKDAQQTYPSHFIVQRSNKMLNLPVKEILYLEASGDYTILHTLKGEYVSSKTLTGLGERLDPAIFIRIHRSNIINMEFLKEVERNVRGSLSVVMQDGKHLPVSRSYTSNIKNRLI